MTMAPPPRLVAVHVRLRAEIVPRYDDGTERECATLGMNRTVSVVQLQTMKLALVPAAKLLLDPAFEQLRDRVADQIALVLP